MRDALPSNTAACSTIAPTATAPDRHPCIPLAVYKGICKRSKETVVLKSYTLSAICELYQHQIYREVRLHSSLQHENIVKLYAAFKVRNRWSWVHA
jgi:serine/threonine protein kinase